LTRILPEPLPGAGNSHGAIFAAEFANDLQNVYIITRLRLNKLLDAS
jgi:hypothetical protein